MIRRKTDYIVVHCAATKAGQDIGVSEIDRWHKKAGWDRIGYHVVIRRSGKVEQGRSIEVAGAHAAGVNHKSVGVCMVGGIADDGRPENNFTIGQLESLYHVICELRTKYPKAEVVGHRDLPDVHKACPSFDVKAWLARVDVQ